MSRARTALAASLCISAVYLASGPALAEVFPGSDDNGYTVYQIRDVHNSAPGGTALGLVVAIGATSLSASADQSSTWAAGQAYWYWGGKNGAGLFCSGNNGTPFPQDQKFTLVPMYMDDDGTITGDASWAIQSDGKIKGCSADQISYDIDEQPLTQGETNHEWGSDSYNYWKVKLGNLNQSGHTRMGELRVNKSANSATEWAFYQDNPQDCASDPPTFKAQVGQYMLFPTGSKDVTFTGCKANESTN